MPTKRRPATRRPRNAAGGLTLQIACGAARAHLPAPRKLRALLEASAGAGARITLRIVGAAEGRALNRRYRGRDYATNVLSFDLGTAPGRARRQAWGDIVLCHPVLRREARAQGKHLADHYAHLIVHGALHLRGYDHLRTADARLMERRERGILRRFGLPDPYLVR